MKIYRKIQTTNVTISETIEVEPEDFFQLRTPDYQSFEYIREPDELKLVMEPFWHMIKRKLTEGLDI